MIDKKSFEERFPSLKGKAGELHMYDPSAGAYQIYETDKADDNDMILIKFIRKYCFDKKKAIRVISKHKFSTRASKERLLKELGLC